MISVRILAPDLVEVTVRPSWWGRLLGDEDEVFRARLVGECWREQACWCCLDLSDVNDDIRDAIERAFRAETARNYQAAAQRGEYPIR